MALAHLHQAHNAFGCGQLRAPSSGVLVDVSGEVGQAGQPIAILAQAGAREVEVHFPEKVNPPASGEIVQVDGSIALHLREKAGAFDPLGRTLRACYTITEKADQLLLGAVIRTRLPIRRPMAWSLACRWRPSMSGAQGRVSGCSRRAK